MGLFSALKDKITLGDKINDLPQYKEKIRGYIHLLVPEDELMWSKYLEEPPATKLLKECLFNNAPAKKAAVIFMITGGGTRTEDFGPHKPTQEFATLYLVTMVALNKLLGVNENITV